MTSTGSVKVWVSHARLVSTTASLVGSLGSRVIKFLTSAKSPLSQRSLVPPALDPICEMITVNKINHALSFTSMASESV